MQFSTLLLAALASSVAMANYNIQLYEKKDCKKTVGKTCSNVAQKTCCGDGGKKYRSAKFEETGGNGGSDDQLKLYKESDCGGAAIKQQTGDKCLSNSKKEVEGAQVFVVITARDAGEDVSPGVTVEPDTHFLEEDGVRYTIKRDTPEGQAYEMLTRFDDQADHLRTFGTRQEIPRSDE